MAKLLVLEATLEKAISFKGAPQSYIATGEGWAGWKIYADTGSRELVVDVPHAASAGRFRVPFENVRYYKSSGVAPKSLTEADDGWAKLD